MRDKQSGIRADDKKLMISLIGMSLRGSAMFGSDIFTNLSLFVLREYALKAEPVRALCSIRICDFYCSDANSSIIDKIVRGGSRIVGFSVYIWNIDKVLKLCNGLKRKRPALKIILGGPAVSPLSRKILGENKNVDIVVRGEGEATFLELVEHYLGLGRRDLCGIRGISYRRGSAIRENRDRRLIENLDEIPSPWPSVKRHLSKRSPPPVIVYQTSRGCPFKCRYCYWGTGTPVRCYSIRRVTEDLNMMLSARNAGIYWVDSNIFLNKKRAKTILGHIVRQNRFARIYYEMNMDSIDADILRLMKRMKNAIFSSGLQDINNTALKAMGRNHFDKGRFVRNLDMVMRKVPDCHHTFDVIYGLPGSTLESYKETINFALSFKPLFIEICRFLVLPGTEFYNNHRKYRVRFMKRPPYGVISTEKFSARDIAEAERIAFYVKLALLLDLREALHSLGEKVYKGGSRMYYLQPILDFFVFVEKHMDLTFGRDYPEGCPGDQEERDLLNYLHMQIHKNRNNIRNYLKLFLLDVCRDTDTVRMIMRNNRTMG